MKPCLQIPHGQITCVKRDTYGAGAGQMLEHLSSTTHTMGTMAQTYNLSQEGRSRKISTGSFQGLPGLPRERGASQSYLSRS